jgi:hypothetical protein
MRLQYHQSAFKLIGKEPVLSGTASCVLDRLERQHDFRFPASLREWYSIKNIYQMFYTIVSAKTIPPTRTVNHAGDEIKPPEIAGRHSPWANAPWPSAFLEVALDRG